MAKPQTPLAIEMVFISKELRPLKSEILRGRNEPRAVVSRNFDERTAGKLRRDAMRRTRRNAHEKDRRSTGRISRHDRRQPLFPVARVRGTRLGGREHLRGDGGARVV